MSEFIANRRGTNLDNNSKRRFVATVRIVLVFMKHFSLSFRDTRRKREKGKKGKRGII